MPNQASSSHRRERSKKGTTLHRRLLLFFVLVCVCLILAFTLLLALFGITGREEKTVQNHISTELINISGTITGDFGRVSLGGITLAEDIAKRCDAFFSDHGIDAGSLAAHPELLEPLLAEQMHTLISAINTRYCGGVFLMLDATVAPNAENAHTAKAGVFLKKTQPTSTQAVGVKLHCLRGPAQIARDNAIMLLGQWHMEFDISGQDFFTQVMDTARANPSLPLSRLYYWSGRVTLKDNSEAGFLLCVPLRSADGTVFGLCGIEISDRLFKSVYSPEGGIYENIFTVMSPGTGTKLNTSQGLIAGNYYLTGSRWNEDLLYTGDRDGFAFYSSGREAYGGKSSTIRLYPNGSPYESESWSAAVLMPRQLLDSAIQGNMSYFICIVVALLAASLVVSFFLSRRYLHPVTEALRSIRHHSHEQRRAVPYLEINDLFDFLAQKDLEHEKKIRQKDHHNQQIRDQATKVQAEYEKAQLELSRLAYSRKREVDPHLYQQFLAHVLTLTPTERDIFDLYISGKHAKEIMEIMCIKENTLKYHNKNIYSKLGVTSRKELLLYAALMIQEQKGGTGG